MNTRHNQPGSIDVVTGVLMGVALLIASVFFILSLAAFCITILALGAWFRPMHIGPMRIDTPRAHAFVRRGLFLGGAFLIFASLASMAFQFPLYWEGVWIIFGIGYSIGSLAVEVFLVLAMNTLQRTGSPSDTEQDSLIEHAQEPRTLPFRYAS